MATNKIHAPSRTRLVLAMVLCFLLGSPMMGCADHTGATGRAGAPRENMYGNGDSRVLMHEEAQAETREMENVVTDFIHANWTEEHTDAARQPCVVDDSHVIENGASDSYSRMGDAVEGDRFAVARAFTKHAESLGYSTDINYHAGPLREVFFNFRSKKGLLMAVTLFADKSWMSVYTPCYSYDWPELTPTPSPSGSAG